MGENGWFFRKNASRAEKLYTCFFFFLLLLMIYGCRVLSFHRTEEGSQLSLLLSLLLSTFLLVPLFRDETTRVNLASKKVRHRLFYYLGTTGLIFGLCFLIFHIAIPAIYTEVSGSDTNAKVEVAYKDKNPFLNKGKCSYELSLKVPPQEELRDKCVDEDVWEKTRLGDRLNVDLRSTHFGFLIGNIER